jgi:hypothetical protein
MLLPETGSFKMSQVQTTEAEQLKGEGSKNNGKRNGTEERGFWAMLGAGILGLFSCIVAVAEAIKAVCSIIDICCLVAA